ncbi:MAG: formyl transferase [Bacteroidetes bacterium]|nr:formyl transferase [Bacteroidota bacterium]
MRIAIIGRTEILYKTAQLLHKNGFEIPLIITSKEAPEYKITSADFKELAAQFKAKFIYSPKINLPEIVQQIKEIPKIDIAVSINYSGVIEQEVIDIFPLGILNAHGGDLPKYRGNACQAWAIINGENKIGLCIHRMVGGELDSGDILEKAYFPTTIDTRVGEVYHWIEQITPSLLLEAINKLSKNPNYILEVQSKSPKDALRCYPRNPTDGKINWNDSRENILRLINASSEPFSGSFTYIENKKVVIWRAQLFTDEENYLAVPGQIASINTNDGTICVITGSGKLKISEVEVDGERCAPASVIKSIRTRFL